MIPLEPLDVVAFKDAGQMPVAPVDEVAGQQVAAAVVVIVDAGDAVQLAVGPVEEEKGTPAS